MESLLAFNDILISQVDMGFVRSLAHQINWKQRMIGIRGTRGVGKTTLLLQKQKELGGMGTTSLYVSLDHPYFYSHPLFELASEFYLLGGRFLLIDEVHKYPKWSRELKNIYDGFPDLKVVFTASSALEIFRGEADLSRRVMMYDLPGLSFREFLKLHYKQEAESVSLDDLLKNHREISIGMGEQIKVNILPLFKDYLRNGYLPLAVEESFQSYPVKLNQVINAILDTDMAYTESYTPSTALKLKKLLALLAESVPFQPNISELARKLSISRDSIYNYLNALERASLIRSLHAKGGNSTVLQKPEKLYLENTNLSYALNPNPDIGNLRETFVLNQLANGSYKVHYPRHGDFAVGANILEVGGRTKKSTQIKEVPKSFLVVDNILNGSHGRIPLWLFGFLY